MRAICLLALFGLMLAPSIGEAAPRRRAPVKKPAPKPAPAPEPEVVAESVKAAPPADPPPPPPGSSKRTVAMLDIRLEGLPYDVRDEFEQQLVDSLDTDSYWVARRERVRELMGYSTRWTDGCVIGDCVREVRAQTQADVALLVALSGAGTSFGYVVTIVRTDTGRVFSQKSGRCEMCVVDKVMHEVILSTIDLINQVPETLPDEQAARAAQVDLAVGKLVKRIAHEQRSTRRKAVIVTLAGLAIAGVGVGLYYGADKPSYALPLAGGGGGLALGGVTVLVF